MTKKNEDLVSEGVNLKEFCRRTLLNLANKAEEAIEQAEKKTWSIWKNGVPLPHIDGHPIASLIGFFDHEFMDAANPWMIRELVGRFLGRHVSDSPREGFHTEVIDEDEPFMHFDYENRGGTGNGCRQVLSFQMMRDDAQPMTIVSQGGSKLSIIIDGEYEAAEMAEAFEWMAHKMRRGIEMNNRAHEEMSRAMRNPMAN